MVPLSAATDATGASAALPTALVMSLARRRYALRAVVKPNEYSREAESACQEATANRGGLGNTVEVPE